MYKYIYVFIAAFLALCSCTRGLSDSKALKIAQDTPEFATAEYMLLRINKVNAAVAESNYIVDGVRVIARKKSDEQIHHFNPEQFIALRTHDVEGNVVNLLGSPLSLSWFNRYDGACAGCVYCFKAFEKKGLLKMSFLDDATDGYGFRLVDVKLTDEGKKYLLKWDDPEFGSNVESSFLNANTGDAVTVKLMQRVYTGAKKVWENDDTAEFYLQYYYELTPYGEALYGQTEKEPGYQTIATYRKNLDGEWSLVKLQDIRRNAASREL